MRFFCLALFLFFGLSTHAYAQQSLPKTTPHVQGYGTIQQYSSAGAALLPLIANYGAAGLGIVPLVGNIVVLARQRQYKTTTMAWGITGTVWGVAGLILNVTMIVAYPETSSISALVSLPAMSLNVANIVLGAINIHRARQHRARDIRSSTAPNSKGAVIINPRFVSSFN